MRKQTNTFVLAFDLPHKMATVGFYENLNPHRTHIMRLYPSGLLSLESGPAWLRRTSLAHGAHNYNPIQPHYFYAEFHYAGDDGSFLRRIDFTLQPNWYTEILGWHMRAP